MLAFVLIGLVLTVIIFAAVVSNQSDEFRISRSATIPGPADKIFPHVNELCKWDAWSPWARLDPNTKNSFEGPAAGVGAIMRWDGNNKVGAGSMTITESKPNELVRFRLEFLRPMKATNTAEFTFRPLVNQTEVTWSMLGHNNFIGKAMGLIFNCEKMVGGQFDKGLTSLRNVVVGK